MTAAPGLELPPGPVAGKYRLGRLLARGGMADVFEASQLPLERPVALKILRPSDDDESQGGEPFRKRFLLEAAALARLQHPNIVALYDVGVVNAPSPTLFLAMELVQGRTLTQVLKQRAMLPWAEALIIVRQIARGLRAAHAQKIIHRDLKPSNVMLVEAGEGETLVKVVDFGIAKVLAEGPEHLTKTGTFLGSPTYVSPEQVQGLAVDERADVYSLGVILYQLLVGRPPFVGAAVDVLAAHIRKPPRPPRELVADLPEAVEQVALRCLAKKPEARFATMDELFSALVRAGGAEVPPPPPSRPIPPVDPDLAATLPDPSAAPDRPAPEPPAVPAAPLTPLAGRAAASGWNHRSLAAIVAFVTLAVVAAFAALRR